MHTTHPAFCVGLSVVALIIGSGCPSDPPPGPCAGGGDVVVTALTRDGTRELVGGDGLEIFPPPQGGVFSEIDLVLEGVSADAIDSLGLTVEVADTNEVLANVRYFGELLPFECNEDDQLTINDLPVGYDESVVLTDADGVVVVLTTTVETRGESFSASYDLVLAVTNF
ncbi:MAG: hypothetical protein K0V04_11260 [Deltaproteobacteria bacterium]|nr:hypothetical protein [Deltaproteobacteria bacterium]